MGRAVDKQQNSKELENVELYADIKFTQLNKITKDKLISNFRSGYNKEPDLPCYLIWKIMKQKPLNDQSERGYRPAATATRMFGIKNKIVYKISFMKEGLN